MEGAILILPSEKKISRPKVLRSSKVNAHDHKIIFRKLKIIANTSRYGFLYSQVVIIQLGESRWLNVRLVFQKLVHH